MELLNPAQWKSPRGFSHGVAASGKQIFVAGQIGWNKKEQLVSTDFVGQAEQALENIVTILAEGGAKASDIVRMNWYVKDKAVYLSNLRALGDVYRRIIGKHFPAMTLIQVADLLEEGALVEIEVTAVVS